jgi:serine/threonine-protein kinase
LTWQPLHPREDIARAMTSTLEGADARCTRRAPDREVPPELEAACVRATAMSPRERFAGVRDLHLAVERYLDGDRDLARRRELAAEWAAQAEAATEKALKAGAGEAARREALEHAGRALALDPHHTAAMGALVKLLLAPPKELPPEVVKELDAAESRTVREAAVRGGLTYLSWILFAPLLWVVGVRSLTPILAWFGCIGLTGVVSFLGGRWVKPTAALHFVTFGLSSVGIMAMAALWGPFVMVPALATANTIAYVVSSKREWAVPTLLIGALTVVVPVLASVAGWMPQMVSFDGDTMITHAWALHMPAQASLFILTFAMVTIVVVSGLYLRRVRSLLASAERALHVQSWHLRQLIPQEAREAILPPGEEVSPLLACPINGRPEKA